MENQPVNEGIILDHFLFNASLTGEENEVEFQGAASTLDTAKDVMVSCDSATNSVGFIEVNLDTSEEDCQSNGNSHFIEINLESSSSEGVSKGVSALNNIASQDIMTSKGSSILHSSLERASRSRTTKLDTSFALDIPTGSGKGKVKGRARLKRAAKRRNNFDNSSTDSSSSPTSAVEKKFSCPLCPMSFNYSRNLTSHKKWKHNSETASEVQLSSYLVNEENEEQQFISYQSDPDNIRLINGPVVGHTVGVEEEKNNSDLPNSSSPSTPLPSYNGDDQILQRYLYDSSIKLSGSKDESDTSNKPPLYKKKEKVGISPAKIGVKFEDCEFNSSDSFASTESIIEKKFTCDLCPKRFMFKGDLKRHHAHRHSTAQYRCPFCKRKKLFNTKSAYSAHAKRCHNMP